MNQCSPIQSTPLTTLADIGALPAVASVSSAGLAAAAAGAATITSGSRFLAARGWSTDAVATHAVAAATIERVRLSGGLRAALQQLAVANEAAACLPFAAAALTAAAMARLNHLKAFHNLPPAPDKCSSPISFPLSSYAPQIRGDHHQQRIPDSLMVPSRSDIETLLYQRPPGAPCFSGLYQVAEDDRTASKSPGSSVASRIA